MPAKAPSPRRPPAPEPEIELVAPPGWRPSHRAVQLVARLCLDLAIRELEAEQSPQEEES